MVNRTRYKSIVSVLCQLFAHRIVRLSLIDPRLRRRLRRKSERRNNCCAKGHEWLH